MSFFRSRQFSTSRLLTSIFLYSPFASVTATIVLYGHSQPVQDVLKLPREQTCPVFLNDLTSTSFPWTHNPTCFDTTLPGGDESSKDTFCVYTNGRFANNRGISIITTPGVATEYLLENFSHEYQEDRGEELYEAREIDGRGVGLFAKEKVKAGQTVILRHPVVIISRNLLHGRAREERHRLLELAVKQLPEKTMKQFLGLAKSRGGFELDDIAQTNAMGMRLGDADTVGHLGVVPEASRINHDCRPNTFYRFDDYALNLNLFALRDIEPGEEITYSYGFQDELHEKRVASLKEHWNFECSCSLCSSSKEKLKESDERLKDIKSIRENLPSGFENIPQFIALLPTLVETMEEEGLVIEKPMYEEILAYSWSALGIEDRAKEWASKARKDWEIIAGKDSYEARRTRELEQDVKGHGTFATWEKDPWDDSVWEDDDHHHDEHDHEHEHEHKHEH